MLRIDPDESLINFTGRLLDSAAEAVIDLAQQPLYIVNRSLARNDNAIFGPGNDRLFEEEIANVGKWNGPGICIVADQTKIYDGGFSAARAAGFDQTQADRHARETLAAILIHELGHAIRAGRAEEEAILAGEWPFPRGI